MDIGNMFRLMDKTLILPI